MDNLILWLIFWFAAISPVLFFATSWIYYVKIQSKKPNSPYSWHGLARFTAIMWLLAIVLFLWLKDLIA